MHGGLLEVEQFYSSTSGSYVDGRVLPYPDTKCAMRLNLPVMLCYFSVHASYVTGKTVFQTLTGFFFVPLFY